jgi:glycosyltransferase involved in cell wall biosynthesis
MGYIGNMLPKHLARLGAEVHYLTMDLPHYFQSALPGAYGDFEGLAITKPGVVEQIDGFTLHGLGHAMSLGQPRFVGLREKLAAVRPDVVQSFLAIGWPPLDAARLKAVLGYRLFTANHTTASVFPLAGRESRLWDPAFMKNAAARFLPGRLISWASDRCYAATVDCADVAIRFFGVQPRKVVVAPLGVDTDLFRPCMNDFELARRAETRARFGFREADVVFIYTGQFSDGKNPSLLARAVSGLAERGLPARGLFVGNGAQAAGIRSTRFCSVQDFVPNADLVRFYQAADVGVWPTQESTSMLDAAACGLPVIVNDTLKAVERVSGNGVQYRLNDLGDLTRVMLSMFDANYRSELGRTGTARMNASFSWCDLARRRLLDYEAAVVSRARERC